MTPQGTSLGGIIIERKDLISKIKNNFRYKKFNEPDKSYNNYIFNESKFPIFTHKLRFTLLRDIGASLSPFNAWLFIQGLSTLSLRIKKQSKNAFKIAKYLQKHEKVILVNYPKLKTHPSYKMQKKYCGKYCGSILSFDVGTFENAKFIVNNIKLFTHAVSIGNSLSIITQPASTTHSQIKQSDLKKYGITPSLLRLSIGLESPIDLINSLKEVLK